MPKKKTVKMVNCRYPKCRNLHETTELKKDDAVKGGSKNSYYHPDCWHTMQTVNKIRDTFVKEINPLLTGKQIGALVSMVNNMIFSKGINVDFIYFALQYFIKNKPGKLQHPAGIHYIVQDSDVVKAWDNEQTRKIREEIREQQKTMTANDEFKLDPPEENSFKFVPQKARSFADILG